MNINVEIKNMFILIKHVTPEGIYNNIEYPNTPMVLPSKCFTYSFTKEKKNKSVYRTIQLVNIVTCTYAKGKYEYAENEDENTFKQL